LEAKIRKEPHSVHTFYNKKKIKGQDYFFGKQFKDNYKYFHAMESYSSIRTDVHSKKSIEKSNLKSTGKSQVVRMDQISEKSIKNSNEADKKSHFNFAINLSALSKSNVITLNDPDFAKLNTLYESDFSSEDIIRYFRRNWGVEVKSVKFVFDFREALPNFIVISKNSYKISKMDQKIKR
jgi:hypothetical protein